MPVRQTPSRKDHGAERRAMRALCFNSRELIDELNRRYPGTMPDPGEDAAVMWSRIGARKLVEFLLAMLAEADGDAGGQFRTTEHSTVIPNSL